MALTDTSPGSWFNHWQPPTDFLPDVHSNRHGNSRELDDPFPIFKYDRDHGRRGKYFYRIRFLVMRFFGRKLLVSRLIRKIKF